MPNRFCEDFIFDLNFLLGSDFLMLSLNLKGFISKLDIFEFGEESQK
jgi:hypothetical protein